MARAKKAADPAAPKAARSRKQVAPAQESSPITASNNVEEIIRQRAYEIYTQRSGNGGSPEEDWFQAEAEILGKSA